MSAIQTGRSTPQLQRKQWGKFLAKEEDTLFSIVFKDGKTLDFEATNASERTKWVAVIGFTALQSNILLSNYSLMTLHMYGACELLALWRYATTGSSTARTRV